MRLSNPAHARTLLFVPGDRPERFDKAAASGADIVVLDLEDAVGVGAKTAARANVVEYVSGGVAASVRINAATTAEFEQDVSAISALACGVMLAKADESSIERLACLLPDHRIIALIETAQGVLDAAAVARMPGVARLALGTIDLAAELRVDPDRSMLLDRARADLAFASAAGGLPGPIDGVTTAIDDIAAITRDVERASDFGFTGKLCIHPRQISSTHLAMRPTPEETLWARAIVAAVDDPANGSVFSVNGSMVDKPVADRARSVLRRADIPI
ncbi:CoA ester lyase [Rhodococcus sp. IEGM 1381]|uniref:HpcH/HpaI aldolase/citrate lyase family protein n=1 Tax=Rhodococcus sp. IEGM 1381 TaxID=3047085 RepID=UPI0024B82911|nr:CoA ester lyase [Rhodococcus sp. IEGM 1381]MDI9894454.1 CoA ester lyase [Rhodococcus sp. IEGM 1381]